MAALVLAASCGRTAETPRPSEVEDADFYVRVEPSGRVERAWATVDGQYIDLTGAADSAVTRALFAQEPSGWVDAAERRELALAGTGVLHSGDTRLRWMRARAELSESAPVRIEVVEMERDLTTGEARTCLRATGERASVQRHPGPQGSVVEVRAALVAQPSCLPPSRTWPEAACVRDRIPACGSRCAEIELFGPSVGPGYVDLQTPAEAAGGPSRSWLRRGLAARVREAARQVACLAGSASNGAPAMQGDMSGPQGEVPTDATGAPAHPPGSHVDGKDLDVAYYQTSFFPDNDFRAVCAHRGTGSEAGVDLRRCTGPPYALDAARTALFVGLLVQTPDVRCIGLDARVAEAVLAELPVLRRRGWLDADADHEGFLCYEAEDTGRGWYRNHHDHLHISGY